MDYWDSDLEGYHWELVQKKNSRSVYRLSRDSEPWGYIKIYHPESFADSLTNRLAPRTAKEARTFEQLGTAGINVPEVISEYRSGARSAVITRAITPGTPLYEFEPALQKKIMLDMTVSLLENKFIHNDLHWGNIVLDQEQTPFLVDAYEVRKKKILKTKDIARMFAQIMSIYVFDDKMIMAHLEHLLPEIDHKKLLAKIKVMAHGAARSRAEDFIKRCQQQSSFTREVQTPDYQAWIYMGNDQLELDRLLAAHRKNLDTGENVLKKQDKTQVSLVDNFCVKSYRKPKPATEPYALRSWKGLLTLHFNGINVAGPIALVIFNDKTSAIVTSALRLKNFDRLLYHDLNTMEVRYRYRLISEYGRMIGFMHARGIYHADLKACNVLVDPDEIKFYLVDTDKVVHYQQLSPAKKIKNLAQINNSIPRDVPLPIRMLFMKNYSKMTGDDPKTLFKEVWLQSRLKEILYTTDHGDEREFWNHA